MLLLLVHPSSVRFGAWIPCILAMVIRMHALTTCGRTCRQSWLFDACSASLGTAHAAIGAAVGQDEGFALLSAMLRRLGPRGLTAVKKVEAEMLKLKYDVENDIRTHLDAAQSLISKYDRASAQHPCDQQRCKSFGACNSTYVPLGNWRYIQSGCMRSALSAGRRYGRLRAQRDWPAGLPQGGGCPGATARSPRLHAVPQPGAYRLPWRNHQLQGCSPIRQQGYGSAHTNHVDALASPTCARRAGVRPYGRTPRCWY